MEEEQSFSFSSEKRIEPLSHPSGRISSASERARDGGRERGRHFKVLAYSALLTRALRAIRPRAQIKEVFTPERK